MRVVIKADDFGLNDSLGVWQRFAETAQELRVPIAIGVVGRHLRSIDRRRVELITALLPDGVEVWNHGYTHEGDTRSPRTEFFAQSVVSQESSLRRTQILAKERLGIDIETFGAPYNRNDQNTLRAVLSIENIQCWFFPTLSLQAERLIQIGILPRENVENRGHQLCQDAIGSLAMKFGESRKGTVPLQMHPGKWTRTSLFHLRKLVSIVVDSGAEFVLPRQCKELRE